MTPSVIAAFDFDGTLTRKDTLFDFLFFSFGKKRTLTGLMVLFPMLLSFKIGLIKNSDAKQRLFSYFFEGMKIESFDLLCKRYAGRINTILKKDVFDKMREHQSSGHTVVIISASIENWIIPWSTDIAVDKVLATQIETDNGILSGRFRSKNCYGMEKVNRLLDAYPDRENYRLYAYGDSNGDKDLLAIADFAFFKRV